MCADIVIRGGTVYDGTGTAGRVADVAVEGGRIVGVGNRLTGRRVLDASGQAVSPGFIDIHTHYDAQVFWDPHLTPSSFHGVTTVVAGNCGFSIAPIRDEHVDLMARTLEHVEDMSFETLEVGVPWNEFSSFAQYLDAVQQRGTALNFTCYVGHTAVRMFVMGDEAYERAATPKEIVRMQEVVAGAIAAGAAGFASSAGPAHNGDAGRPVPSRLSDLDELRDLLQPLRSARRGVVALVPGDGLSHQDIFALQREIGRPFTWTALLASRGNIDHEKIIAEHDEAWAEGVEVWPQVACRPLVFEMNLLEPFTLNLRPTFGALMGCSVSDRKATYRDPSWREMAWAEMNSGSRPLNWATFSVADSGTHPDLVNRPVVSVAEQRGCTPLDVMLDVSLDDDLTSRFTSVLANNDVDIVTWLLQRDNVLLGLADSGAHVSQLCDACFATDLLGHWVREREVMPLERAVYKLSGEPAAVYGLADRGTIEVGKAADICVFDPTTVAPGPLRRVRDFPGDGERLIADSPVGVTHVLVNGVSIRTDGAPHFDGLDSRPGRSLRS